MFRSGCRDICSPAAPPAPTSHEPPSSTVVAGRKRNVALYTPVASRECGSIAGCPTKRRILTAILWLPGIVNSTSMAVPAASTGSVSHRLPWFDARPRLGPRSWEHTPSAMRQR